MVAEVKPGCGYIVVRFIIYIDRRTIIRSVVGVGFESQIVIIVAVDAMGVGSPVVVVGVVLTVHFISKTRSHIGAVGAEINVVVVRVTVVRVVIYIDRRTLRGVGEVIYTYRRTVVVASRIRFAVAVGVGAWGVGIIGRHWAGRASFRVG